MEIKIKSLSGKTIIVNVDSNESVKGLQQKIFEETGIKIGDQKLIFAGKCLLPGHSIIDYNVQKESTISLYSNLVGSKEWINTKSPTIEECYAALNEEGSEAMCQKLDDAHVQGRAIHFGILSSFIRVWLLKADRKVSAVSACLENIKEWSSIYKSSVASAIYAYTQQEKLKSMKGFKLTVDTAFGNQHVEETRDVSPVGVPSLFVSYTWTSHLANLIHFLVRELTSSQKGLFHEIQKEESFSGRLWIDCFSINQHGGSHTTEDVNRIQDVIKSSTHGTVLYLENLRPLTRIWCIFELFHSIINEKQIWFLIPFINTGIYGRSDFVGLCLFLAAGLGNKLVDVAKAQATVASDRETILTMVEAEYGINKVNALVREMITRQANISMRTFLERSTWTNDYYPDWSNVTRHERLKQLPGWLKRLEKHLDKVDITEEAFYRKTYESLGIAFMEGEKTMNAWLGIDWQAKNDAEAVVTSLLKQRLGDGTVFVTGADEAVVDGWKNDLIDLTSMSREITRQQSTPVESNPTTEVMETERCCCVL